MTTRRLFRGSLRTATRRSRISLVAALLITAAGLNSFAQPLSWTEDQKLVANDAVAGIGFGDSGALDGSVALIGATANGLANLSAGAVYVLERNGATGEWEHDAKLQSDDAELDDRFGWSISLKGDVALIGAPDEEEGGFRAGAAYVFRSDGGTWGQEQKLVATGPGDVGGFRFGRSGAINGTLAVVGAPSADGPGGPTGAAYVFVYQGSETGWVSTQTLIEESFATMADYGTSVAAHSGSGGTEMMRVIIGAPRSGPGAQNLGAAFTYRFQGDTLAFEQKLTAEVQDPQDMFGESVALDDTVLIVGAHQDDDQGAFAGAAHIFRWDGDEWVFEQKLLASDGAEDDHFGSTVAIQGNVALVGAPDHDGDALSSGAVYVFEFDGETWTETQILAPGDPGIGDHFGESLAYGGGRILIGASNNDDGGESAGSAYVFSSGGTGTATEGIPETFVTSLEAYPNPITGHATLSYELAQPGLVELVVYDALGREVLTGPAEYRPAGMQRDLLTTEGLPVGVYFVRLNAAGRTATAKLVRAR